jgi:hypothetical protein
MNKKIIGIIVGIVLIALVCIPATGTFNVNKTINEDKDFFEDIRQETDTRQKSGLEDDYDWQIISHNVITGHGGNYPSGNVGIGTKSPSELLDVAGTAKVKGFKMTTGAYEGYILTTDGSGVGTWQEPTSGGIGGGGTTDYIPKFTDTTTIGNSVIYENDGKIGVGTTSPLYPLTVKGNIASFPGDNSGLVFVGYSNGGGQITTQTSDGFFNNIFIKWGQTRFQGKVGIGEAHTPLAHLHVIAGAAGDTAIRGRSSGWAGYFEGKSYFSDNVGIGTNNPNYKLDVFDGNGIVAQFSGRVKGGQALYDDEFVTKAQLKSVVMSCVTPTGTSDTIGDVGDTAWDNDYFYVKTPDGWKRASLETWETQESLTK